MPEQVITKQLIACGLDFGSVSIAWEDELQSIEVAIKRNARVPVNIFACIHKAAAGAIVRFEEPTLQTAYTNFELEMYRPKLLALAKEAVTRLGLLDDFPKRSDYPDLGAYAHALERHCGLKADSTLRVSGDIIYFAPAREADFVRFEARYEKILAATMYASVLEDDVKFGSIGNEAIAESSK